MVKLSATRCSCIDILWVSPVSFAAISLCVASQWVFVVVVIYFVIDSVRKVKVNLSLCFNWAPRHEGLLGEWRCSSTHSLTSAVDGNEWSASRPGPFTAREIVPGTHWIGGWVGPRAGVDTVVKRKIPSSRWESNPRTPIVQPIAQRYTDWAIMTLNVWIHPVLLSFLLIAIPWNHILKIVRATGSCSVMCTVLMFCFVNLFFFFTDRRIGVLPNFFLCPHYPIFNARILKIQAILKTSVISQDHPSVPLYIDFSSVSIYNGMWATNQSRSVTHSRKRPRFFFLLSS
jgi:hypothetical protein